MNKKLLLFVLIIFTAPLLAVKNIVIGIEFLVEPDTKKAFGKMSWWGTASAAYSKMTGSNPEKQFFTALNLINPNRNIPHKLVWKGQEAPQALYEHLIESSSYQDILKKIKEGLSKQSLSNNERQLVIDLAEIAFDPEKNTDVMKMIPEGVKLAEEFVKKQYRVFIAENWNSKAKDKLRTKFFSTFNLFNGIFVSGEAKVIKSAAFYDKFFAEFKLDPNDTLIIETEKEYVAAIDEFNKKNKKNVKVILCENQNFKELKKQLKKMGVLK